MTLFDRMLLSLTTTNMTIDKETKNMADIELVIKIPEGLKKDFELEQWTALSCMEMKNALEKATPPS